MAARHRVVTLRELQDIRQELTHHIGRLQWFEDNPDWIDFPEQLKPKQFKHALRDATNSLHAARQMMIRIMERFLELVDQLEKHRKPKRNVERNREIVAMDKAGKTSGQIFKALHPKYQSITLGIIRVVLSRHRGKKRTK